jgi:ferredoxin-like protein FixX
MSELQDIVDKIFRSSYATRLVRIDAAISSVAPSAIGCDQIEAEDYAERNKRRVWNKVIRRLDEEIGKGLHPTFEVVDATRVELAWFPMMKRGDDSQLKRKKLRLACRGRILDYLDEDEVSSRAYEALGCVICKLAGASQWHLTPPGNEFGIDFLALLPSFGKSHLFPHADKQIRIVGQSKKWSSRIERDVVRLLADTLDDIRKRNQRILESTILPPWFVSAKGPLVGCMMAHSGAQSGGHDIANDHGIIMADSRDIAEIATLSRRWNPTLGSQGAIEFLRDSISEVLQS